MGKRNQRVKSFKENLKRMLLLYSLIPVFQVMILCVAVIVCVGSFFVVSRSRKTNREISQTLGNTLTSYESLLDELSGQPQIVDPKTSTTRRQKLVRKLYTVSVATGYEAELYILDLDYNVCVSTGEEAEKDIKDRTDREWRILELLKETPEQTALYVQTMGSNKKIYLGSVVRDGEQPTGYVVAAIPSREFTLLLSNTIQKNLITDESGWVYASGSHNFVDEVGRLEREVKDQKGFFAFEKGQYYSTVSDVWNGALRIYTITDNTDSIGVLTTVLITGTVILFAVLLISLSSAERMAVKSTADIRKINNAFEDVMDGNLNAYLDIRSSTEFENIGKCYNQMLDSLKRQIAANKELAETVAYAQVRQLESQFNAHFLFNTLDNIRFMCKIDAELAEFMTVSLSELLRYNTSNANEKVTVEEDLKYIRIYLEIMKVRFREHFDYRIEPEDEVLDAPMPKLLLQPVIENAIKYGFGDREHLNVQVRACREQEDLVFFCEDDGVGFAPELLDKVRNNLTLPKNESTHMGLYNVHRRIQLMYGEQYGILVESRGTPGAEAKGVCVTVRLPYEAEEDIMGGEE